MKKPTLAIVAARSFGNEIGQGGQLPWTMPDDLKRFRAITLGHLVIMGRRTFQSIGKPLPKRENLIITRDISFTAEGCKVAHSLDEALEIAGHYGDEVMLIGGAELFIAAVPHCDRMYLTTIQQTFPEADAFFPAFSVRDWVLRDKQEFAADEKNPYACCLEIIERSIS